MRGAVLILLLLSISGFSQTNTILKDLEAEINSKVRILIRGGFQKNNNSPFNEKYKGNILNKGNNWISYDGWMIEVLCDKTIRTIFTSGLIYPAILAGTGKGNIWHPIVFNDSVEQSQREFIRDVTLDSSHIALAQELPQKAENENLRFFYFHLYNYTWKKRIEYSFALMNANANRKTPLEEFIKGANLLYLHPDNCDK